jgi:hypothetical protein
VSHASLSLASTNPDRWREVSRIYGAVLTKPPDARAAALDKLCAHDGTLRREVCTASPMDVLRK